MSTIIDFKPYRRLLFDNTNYYLLNDFGNEVELEMVRKREVGKLVKVDKLGRWVVQADHPDLETLKYVLIDNVTPVHFTLTEEGFANGADVIVVPNPIIPPDQPGTMKVKYPVEINFEATENRQYEIQPEDPDTQVMEKVNLSVGVKKNFYLNKDEVPPELQVIIIENPDEEEGGSILHKKIIDKEVTITTNGDTTLTPDANEVYNIVKIHTMIPQSITIDPSQIPEDKTVIVVENEEGDEPQTQIISKEWEHKEIEITENGETVVEATEGKVLRDVTITTNVSQEVTIESSETGRKPGYDIIYVPYLDEEGHIDPTHESDPVFKKGVEKVRTITTNHSTTEITPSSNEILNKVTVKVEVPQTQEYVFGDNNIIDGHDTVVIPKDPNDTSPPTIRSVNWETVNKEFNHNIENYEITATSNEYILDKVNVKVNVPMQDKTVTLTHNGETTIEPDENYDAMTSTTINVNVPIEGNLEEKEVDVTEPGEMEILPSEGYDAMTKVTLNVDAEKKRDYYLTGLSYELVVQSETNTNKGMGFLFDIDPSTVSTTSWHVEPGEHRLAITLKDDVQVFYLWHLQNTGTTIANIPIIDSNETICFNTLSHGRWDDNVDAHTFGAINTYLNINPSDIRKAHNSHYITNLVLHFKSEDNYEKTLTIPAFENIEDAQSITGLTYNKIGYQKSYDPLATYHFISSGKARITSFTFTTKHMYDSLVPSAATGHTHRTIETKISDAKSILRGGLDCTNAKDSIHYFVAREDDSTIKFGIIIMTDEYQSGNSYSVQKGGIDGNSYDDSYYMFSGDDSSCVYYLFRVYGSVSGETTVDGDPFANAINLSHFTMKFSRITDNLPTFESQSYALSDILGKEGDSWNGTYNDQCFYDTDNTTKLSWSGLKSRITYAYSQGNLHPYATEVRKHNKIFWIYTINKSQYNCTLEQ